MPAAFESVIVMATMTAASGLLAQRDRVNRPAPVRARAWVGWLGVADSMNVLLFFAAYKLSISVAVLAHYLTPLLVAIAAPLVLREAMTRRTMAAAAASLFGLAVILGRPVDATASAVWASAALGAGSALFYASNVIANKFIVDDFSTSEVMFWHGVIATPFLALFVPWSACKTVDPRAIVFLATTALGPGAIAGLAFVWGLRRMPAAHASTLTLLEPLVAVVLAGAYFGEPLSWRTLLGGALILAGALAVMTQRRSEPVLTPAAVESDLQPFPRS
jgi:drug/metabolite transporter (DMT)-like permease